MEFSQKELVRVEMSPRPLEQGHVFLESGIG